MRHGIFIIGIMIIASLLGGCIASDTGGQASQAPTATQTPVPSATAPAPTPTYTPTATVPAEATPVPSLSAAEQAYGLQFTVLRTGSYTVQIDLASMGRANSIRGFRVIEPALADYSQFPANDTSISPPWTIIITDRNLTGTVHLVVNSSVNGHDQTVIDRMI